MDSRSLNILEFPKLLDQLGRYAVSEAGAAACRSLRPQADLATIRREMEFFAQGQLWLEASGFKLINFPDLSAALDQLAAGRQTPDLDTLWTLRQVLGQASALVESVLEETRRFGLAEARWPLLIEYCERNPLPQLSLNALARCLSEDGFIRDEASPDLLLVRGELRRIHQQCNRKAGDFARQYNITQYLQDDFITLSSDRYVLPLKSNFKGRLQGIIHDYSQTGETCYFEPMFLVELNNRLQELKREEREEERKVLLYLAELLTSELPFLRSAYELMLSLDVLQAKHRLGLAYDGRLPSFADISDGQSVDLREARHPLLALAFARTEAARRSGRPKEAAPEARPPVPTDITLKPGQRALVISGGNAGGKTVCLKTLGLIALMGMCAIPVPVAPGSSLPVWSFILPFIGDDQSLEDHVSTFTAQITQLAENWPRIDADSLVILDEFGAGTDPAQGAALAQAVIDELLERGAHVFAATHFPALKAYAMSREQVRAASVLFDPLSKKPLYKLVYDQVGASQALDVAREHGLPEDVLKRAQHYLLLDGEDTGLLIERLNSLAVEREREIQGLKKESEAYRQKRSRLEEKFALERKKLFDNIQAEAQGVLRDWKTSRVSHKQALKSLARLRTELLQEGGAEAAPQAAAPLRDISALVPGQTVFYRPWSKKGQVLELDTRRGRVRIDFAGVTMWTDLADLAPENSAGAGGANGSGGSAKGPARPAGSIVANVERSSGLRLDLRGKRADFALAELARYIDSAILGGRDQVEIIHGRGTGALRREIHAYLKDNPAIKSYALAPEDQGGDGVTLAELK